jgi:Na+-translocating ferredoxin:NAD+ oxidoreductase RnfG subunit
LRAALGIAITWDTLNVFVADNGAKRVGYAIIDEVRGKDQPITYCVVVDELLAVKQVAILAYREPYGGEVQNASWLKQFSGKQPGDKLRPGKEIKTITGATISARAITLGVKKLLTLLHVIAPRLQSLASVSK